MIKMKKTNFLIISMSVATLIFISMVLNAYIGHEKSTARLIESEKSWLENHGTLVYAADNNAPPLRFVDESDGQYKGVVVDYVNLLSLQLGVNIEVHPLLWEKALVNLSEGKSDLCDMFSSEERAKHFVFTDPIYSLRAVVVSNYEMDNLSNIGKLHFATQEGDYVNEYLRTKYPGIEITTVPDVSHALDLLIAGEVEAVAGDEPVILYKINQKDDGIGLKIARETLYDKDVVFAVPKSKKELVSIINKGISAIESTDQLERIQQKWFGISTPIVQMPDNSMLFRVLFALFGTFGVVVIGMFVWNKSLKKEVDRRTKEVLNSKNDLQITFDGMTEYIALIDLEFKVININKSYLEFLGLEKNDVIQKSQELIFKKFSTEEFEDMSKYVMKTEKNISKEVIKNYHHYVVRIYPLKDSSDILKNLLVIVQNVTKEKLSENKLLQANKMAAIGQLAAGMAHEIRNPLGIIRNQSFILESKVKDDKTNRSFALINSSVERAGKIIDNLLEFSRLTDDEKRWINLNEFISKLLSLENKTMMKKGIYSKLNCDENIKIFSNIESLKHILINLISNAIDAVERDGEIEINCFYEEDLIKIQVIDTGIGIDKDETEKIFNPFYTTKEIGKGTGLGLYIAYNESKKLGGDLNYKMSEDKRTIFEITLPV